MSRPDFTARIAVAYKECRETVMLLRLIRDANLVPASRLSALFTEAAELRAILGSSLKTTRKFSNPQILKSYVESLADLGLSPDGIYRTVLLHFGR